MKKYLFVLLAFSLFSCGDDEPETPQCMLNQIEEFKTAAPCDGDNVTTWDFQGEKVYCFVTGSCGIAGPIADIYNGDCNLICTMGGGLSSCAGVPWAENANNEVLIWQK